MNTPEEGCGLCGLPLRHGCHVLDRDGRQARFCCEGCRQVFIMLSEASDATDPADFRSSDLFRRCVEAGIVPRSEAELAAAAAAANARRPLDPPARSLRGGAGTLLLDLSIEGMWCPACAWVIEETLRKRPGIRDVVCQFATDRLRCAYDPTRTGPVEIEDLVRRMGYRAHPPESGVAGRHRRAQFVRFAVSAFLTMNVMMLSFALYTGFFATLEADAVGKISWPMFFMATAVIVYGGMPIFRKGWTGIVGGQPGMEALIGIGALSAYGYSVVNLLNGSIHLYFDTTCMLVFLVQLGKLLERRAKDRIQAELGHYFALMPAKVRLCRGGDRQGRYVAVEQLAPGDLFRVIEGETLAADGLVIEGRGLVDVSSLTGEARPQPRGAGDRLAGGMRILEGNFRLQAEHVGPESTLGQMIAIMDGALSRRILVEDWTDRILRWFVPVMILLAAGTAGVLWVRGAALEAAFARGLTVLVISCPCALGLAVPLARVAGVSLAAKRGIVVQDFAAFNAVERVDTVVFDKTGTLTQGQWQLQCIESLADLTERDILALAAGLEQRIDHPTAVAVRRAAEARRIDAFPVTTLTPHARGVAGLWQGRAVQVGLPEKGDTGATRPDDGGAASAGSGAALTSWVDLTVNGRLVGRLGFGDRLKPKAAEAVQSLRDRGLDLRLVSGDSQAAAERVGAVLGIPVVKGDQSPADKARVVEALRREGRCVVMVGDGINDAPALASADLSVALYAGRHLGEEAQAVTLMEGDPLQLVSFFEFARKVNRKIELNLWGSLIYNLVSIPVAMAGWLSPLVAVAAMLLSSLSVTGNTLLLIRSENTSKRHRTAGPAQTGPTAAGPDPRGFCAGRGVAPAPHEERLYAEP